METFGLWKKKPFITLPLLSKMAPLLSDGDPMQWSHRHKHKSVSREKKISEAEKLGQPKI